MEWWSDGKGEGWKIGRLEATRYGEATGRAKLLLATPSLKTRSLARPATEPSFPSFPSFQSSTLPSFPLLR
jgi:hypothetical protein